jgi:thioesterase domain-containing protein
MDLRGYSNLPSALGWDAYCPRLEVRPVPGNHSDIVAEPTVIHIAREMERRMRSAEIAAGQGSWALLK